MITFEAVDDTGREVAPRQTLPEPRPEGPWAQNADTRVVGVLEEVSRYYSRYITVLQVTPILQICAWCDPQHVGTRALKEWGLSPSHGICPVCASKVFGEEPEAA